MIAPALTRRLDAGGGALDPARARDAGRALGRLAVLRARLGSRSSPRNLNMFTLIALGTGGGVRYSVVARLVPGALPARRAPRRRAAGVLRGRRGDRHARAARPGARAARAQRHAGAIRALLGLAPKTARRLRADGARGGRAARATCSRATACACGPARRCPVDGVVLEGTSAVDESMVTGEPIPVEKAPGSRGHRRHRERHRRLRDARRARRRRHAARADRPDGRARRSAAARRSSASPTSSSAWFVPAVVAGRGAHRVRRGASGAPSRAWPTRWSTRSRCSSSPARARSASPRRCRSWWRPAAAPRRAC